jgi:PAS domain S-box-containing protein
VVKTDRKNGEFDASPTRPGRDGVTATEYERLVEASPDAIAHVAADGEILAANPAMADLLERDREAIAGANLQEVFPGDAGERYLEAGRRALDAGEPERTEDCHGSRYVHAVLAPVETGERGSFQFVARDITDRRSRERALERDRERLETVTSVVSHDLRNPLNVAQSSVELVGDNPGGDHLDRLDRSLDRIGRVIDDLVAFVRERDPVTDPSPVDLATIAVDAWAGTGTGSVSLEVDADCRVEADPERLRTLLGHLFANAVEHGSAEDRPGTDDAPDGGVSTVRVGLAGDGFFVADDGPGIPPDRREDVLEVGYTTARGGTGIGLNVARTIATAHGWSLELGESASGGLRVDVEGVTEA